MNEHNINRSIVKRYKDMNLLYYKTIAPYYDLIIPRDIKGICDSVEQFIGRFLKTKEILDLGCGTGRFAIELAKRGYKVTGLDITEEMLKVARQNAKKAKIKIKFTYGDIRNFDLKKKTSIIWARGSIGDLTNMQDIKKALINIRKNLSKNGLFIFDVRDYNDHLKKHAKGYVYDTRIYQKKDVKVIFNFKLALNKRTKIANIRDTVMIESTNGVQNSKGYHKFRYYTKNELIALVTATGYKIIKVLSSYPSAKENKPRLIVIAQNGN